MRKAISLVADMGELPVLVVADWRSRSAASSNRYTCDRQVDRFAYHRNIIALDAIPDEFLTENRTSRPVSL
jgi:hypothetical protein